MSSSRPLHTAGQFVAAARASFEPILTPLGFVYRTAWVYSAQSTTGQELTMERANAPLSDTRVTVAWSGPAVHAFVRHERGPVVSVSLQRRERPPDEGYCELTELAVASGVALSNVAALGDYDAATADFAAPLERYAAVLAAHGGAWLRGEPDAYAAVASTVLLDRTTSEAEDREREHPENLE